MHRHPRVRVAEIFDWNNVPIVTAESLYRSKLFESKTILVAD